MFYRQLWCHSHCVRALTFTNVPPHLCAPLALTFDPVNDLNLILLHVRFTACFVSHVERSSGNLFWFSNLETILPICTPLSSGRGLAE